MARKDIGEMKRAAGFQNEFWNRFVDRMIARSGSADHLYVADNQGLDAAAKAAVTALIGNTPIGTIVGSLELTVDHGQFVEQMVEAGGYNRTNGNITDANFPHPREGVETVTIDLVKFSQAGTRAERERQLEAFGELAEMDDMLATGAQHPDEQRNYPIVFLGSTWSRLRGDRVGCLGGDADDRRCELYWDYPGSEWAPHCVFAVRRRK